MSIEEYLDRMCASLTVDPLRRDEIRLETHLHLRERVEDLVSQGMDRPSAEDRAVTEFGDPSEIGERLSRNRPFSLPRRITPPIRNAAILLFALGFEQSPGLLLSANNLISHPQPLTFQRTGMPILLILFPMISAAGLLQGRSWARWTGALASAVYLSLLLSAIPQQYAHFGDDWALRLLMTQFPQILLWLYILALLLYPRNWKTAQA
jgi:hypothetical protein